jgi:hypothetical protein
LLLESSWVGVAMICSGKNISIINYCLWENLLHDEFHFLFSGFGNKILQEYVRNRVLMICFLIDMFERTTPFIIIYHFPIVYTCILKKCQNVYLRSVGFVIGRFLSCWLKVKVQIRKNIRKKVASQKINCSNNDVTYVRGNILNVHIRVWLKYRNYNISDLLNWNFGIGVSYYITLL